MRKKAIGIYNNMDKTWEHYGKWNNQVEKYKHCVISFLCETLKSQRNRIEG